MNNYPFTFETTATLKGSHFGKPASKVKYIGDWKEASVIASLRKENDMGIELKVQHLQDSLYYKTKQLNRDGLKEINEEMAKKPLPLDIYSMKVMMAREMHKRIPFGQDKNHGLYHIKTTMPLAKVGVVRSVANDLLTEIKSHFKTNFDYSINCQWEDVDYKKNVAHLVLHVESTGIQLTSRYDDIEKDVEYFQELLFQNLSKAMNEYRIGKLKKKSGIEVFIHEDFSECDYISELPELEPGETLFEVTMNGLSIGIHYYGGQGEYKMFDIYATDSGLQKKILDKNVFYNSNVLSLVKAVMEVEKAFENHFGLELPHTIHRHENKHVVDMLNVEKFYSEIGNVFQDIFSFHVLWSYECSTTCCVVIWDDERLKPSTPMIHKVYKDLTTIFEASFK